MTDIVEFIKARVDEDEQVAQAAKMTMNDTGEWRAHHGTGLASVKERGYYLVVDGTADETADHIARHDPARVLREVEAKRAIVAMYEAHASAQFPDFDGGYSSAAEDAVAHLALCYAGHPDYRTEWAS